MVSEKFVIQFGCHSVQLRIIVRVARTGIQENQKLLDTGFRRYDGEDLNDLFNGLWFQDTSSLLQARGLQIGD